MVTISLQCQRKNAGMVAEESQVCSGSEAVVLNCSLHVILPPILSLLFGSTLIYKGTNRIFCHICPY